MWLSIKGSWANYSEFSILRYFVSQWFSQFEGTLMSLIIGLTIESEYVFFLRGWKLRVHIYICAYVSWSSARAGRLWIMRNGTLPLASCLGRWLQLRRSCPATSGWRWATTRRRWCSREPSGWAAGDVEACAVQGSDVTALHFRPFGAHSYFLVWIAWWRNGWKRGCYPRTTRFKQQLKTKTKK